MQRLALVLVLCAVAALSPAQADELTDGIAAYKRKDYERALALLAPLARDGSARAQLWLGEMYYYGHGVAEDNDTAFEWFSRAAGQGNAEAQVQLANLYLFGQGVPVAEAAPDVKAAQWYFAAARQGHPEAQYNLGLLFAVGKGVEPSLDEARKWMERAAAQGHPDAQAFIAAYQ
jgi:TPR repeat protein